MESAIWSELITNTPLSRKKYRLQHIFGEGLWTPPHDRIDVCGMFRRVQKTAKLFRTATR